MEKSEPTLVPEWLRSTGGGSSSHNFVSSSSSNSDVLLQSTRNIPSKSICDSDSPRSAFLHRSSSTNSRRSTSNNVYAKHAYSSFSRNHRDKDREREKDRSSFGDRWGHEYSDPLGNIFTSRLQKDPLRRSNSMVSRKQDELLFRRPVADVDIGNHYNSNGVLSGGSIGSTKLKSEFEKDFPSLGIDQRQGAPDVRRVSSAGLSTSMQSLIVNSALVGAEGWRSALVLPSSSDQQTAVAPSGSSATNPVASLNMAEALAQSPSGADTIPLLSVKTQRLEELAIKQSRQLIPVRPTMSKTLVLSSSDKSKTKTSIRNCEMIAAPKSGQQQLSSAHLANQSPRVGPVKSDAAKTSHGKFLILKPARENGICPSAREVSSPTSNSTQLSVALSTSSATLKSSNDPKPSTLEHRALNTGSTAEKRPSSSQSQSRRDFLNLMRKKSSVNTTTSVPYSGPVVSSPSMEKSGEAIEDVVSALPESPHVLENGGEINSNCITREVAKSYSNAGEKNRSPNVPLYPEEEEVAFLRSLGWEENGEEDEGLTEEEITAFYQEYMKLRPTMKLNGGIMLKLSLLHESHHATTLDRASSGLSSSDSGSDN